LFLTPGRTQLKREEEQEQEGRSGRDRGLPSLLFILRGSRRPWLVGEEEGEEEEEGG